MFWLGLLAGLILGVLWGVSCGDVEDDWGDDDDEYFR